MKSPKQLLFFILLFVTGSLFSQQTKFNKVLSPIGGFSGFVGGITQDKYGYMWFATRAGLFKYDGYKFKTYFNNSSDNNSLTNNQLETVYADRKGMIWIATWINGLDKLDPETGKFTHFKHDPANPGSMANDTVRAFLEDRDGTFWIGNSGGLDKYDPRTEKFQHYSHDPNDPSSLSCNRVRILYEDKQGTIWVGTGSVWGNEGGGTDEGGLNRFDKHTGKFTRYMHDPNDPHSLINNKVNAILEDSKGNFWVGTDGDGLHTMNMATGSFERHLYDPAHPEKLSRPPLYRGTNFGKDYITFIKEDALQNIWIGTLSNGINRYDLKTQKISHYGAKDNSEGFIGYGGWCYCNSADGNIWIGTYEGGLYRVDPYRKNIDFISTGFRVRAFHEDSAVFWIGTENGLVFQNKKTGAFGELQLENKSSANLANNVISSLFRDSEGTLWVGTGRGLNRFNEQSRNFTAFVNDPNNNNSITSGSVFAIKEESPDSLWIATENGLDLMNKHIGSFIHFKNDPKDSSSIASNLVAGLLRERSGDLWVALYQNGGLDLLSHETRTFRHFLKDISVAALLRDFSGTLWVGADDGIYKTSDPGKGFEKFLPREGIEITRVLSMLEDDQHKIWVSCNSGIIRIDPATNQTTVYGSNYEVNAGNLAPIAGYKGRDGTIYFGELNGYYVLHPEKFFSNAVPPQIIITDFSIRGKPVTPGEKNIPDISLATTKKLSLSYEQNVFSFSFAGIHYSDPLNNQHLYRLENYDRDWRDAGSGRTASYYNVPPGHYVLHIKASNNDGVWAEKTIEVIISSPWWETWWFRVLSVIAMVVVIYSIIKERSRKLKAENILLEQKVNERTRQLQQSIHDLKSAQTQLVQSEKMASLGELTAGIAHEIQNPLNFVNNFSEVNSELITEMKIEIDKGNMDEVRSIANNIDENEQKIIFHGKRADAIVKSMLQHSRTSSGQKELTDINVLADEYLRLAYHGLRAKDKSFNAKFETDLDPAVGEINIVPQDIGRVLLNLINNAFYAANEKEKLEAVSFAPLVVVSTKRISDRVEIRVKDNGNGIPQKIVDKIFQPFFTTKATGQGTGLGLSLAYDIVKAHGGEIKVETKEGEGSEFIIQLPGG